jgi:hypothetical protein
MKNYLKEMIFNIFVFIMITQMIYFIKTQESEDDTYDPCAYVGTSIDKELPQFCLDTHINCCYFAFEWKNTTEKLNHNFVYYSCINKKRLLKSANDDKNLTSAFLIDISDEAFSILSRTLYVNCTDSSDVDITKGNIIPPSMTVTQRLLIHDDYDNENFRNNYNNTNGED